MDEREPKRDMSVIWHKVWRDLVHAKARTALVVLSIAAGVFALGLVFGARDAGQRARGAGVRVVNR